MAEYIEREALIERVKTLITQIPLVEENRDMFYHDSGVNGAITRALLEVEKAPTSDVVEVVHGAWENYPSHAYRRCSVCKVEFDKPKFNVRANYCPHCGAKMDGERRSE